MPEIIPNPNQFPKYIGCKYYYITRRRQKVNTFLHTQAISKVARSPNETVCISKFIWLCKLTDN